MNSNSFKNLHGFTNPTSNSPRLSTMMNIKEKGMRFNSPGPDLVTINAQISSHAVTGVNVSPSPSKDTPK